MATVVFSSELQRLTGEEKTFVSANNYRDLVAQVTGKYPALQTDELMAMAVSIDGVIIHDPLLETIDPDSEVHFLYKISGG